MPVLNHHIVAAADKQAAALFFAEVFGLDQPVLLGEFAVLKVSTDTTLDFIDTDDEICQQHYAFLVTEAEFDEIVTRLRERHLTYWSDPFRRDAGNVNHWDDGRRLLQRPNWHLLEIITRAYGSGGTEAQHPHPLVAPLVDPTP